MIDFSAKIQSKWQCHSDVFCHSKCYGNPEWAPRAQLGYVCINLRKRLMLQWCHSNSSGARQRRSDIWPASPKSPESKFQITPRKTRTFPPPPTPPSYFLRVSMSNLWNTSNLRSGDDIYEKNLLPSFWHVEWGQVYFIYIRNISLRNIRMCVQFYQFISI